jgi:gluconokinase
LLDFGDAKGKGVRRLSEAYVLALDVGSSSVRASLYDSSGSRVEGAEAKLEHDLRYTSDGGATKEAAELLDLLARAIDEALARAGRRAEQIIGVGLATFWHSLLGLDAHGEPTTPVLTWADRRAAVAADRLSARLDERAIYRRVGCPFHSSYHPAKLLWLSEAHPGIFSRTARWVSPGDYLYGRLFGREAHVGTSMASATGLFDQNARRWDGELIGALPVEEDQLSGISDEPMMGLADEWAARWPALREVPWFPAVGDGACSNVGSGCTTREKLALMVGTSGAMRLLWVADEVEVPEGPWCYRADAGRFVMGGALSDGGNLVEWLRDSLRLPGMKETEAQLAAMEPDAHGLTLLPIFAGERGPGWADRANGTISGLSMTSEPVEILRAAMEAIALRFALIMETLDGTFPGEKEVVASGGGLVNSPTWTRIMADCLGKTVSLSGVREASSRGAALLTLERLGKLRIEDAEVSLGQTFQPDPERHEVYREALKRQRELYRAILESPGSQP